jgi:hypothetical protein
MMRSRPESVERSGLIASRPERNDFDRLLNAHIESARLQAEAFMAELRRTRPPPSTKPDPDWLRYLTGDERTRYRQLRADASEFDRVSNRFLSIRQELTPIEEKALYEARDMELGYSKREVTLLYRVAKKREASGAAPSPSIDDGDGGDSAAAFYYSVDGLEYLTDEERALFHANKAEAAEFERLGLANRRKRAEYIAGDDLQLTRHRVVGRLYPPYKIVQRLLGKIANAQAEAHGRSKSEPGARDGGGLVSFSNIRLPSRADLARAWSDGISSMMSSTRPRAGRKPTQAYPPRIHPLLRSH